MKVYMYIKHKPHPQLAGQGMQEGDICYIYPMVEDQGRLTLDTYVPVVIDINIPCGQGEVPGMDFVIPKGWQCVKCPFNDIVNCDVIKYTRAIWTTGDALNPPSVEKKRSYKIDISTILDSAQITQVKKETKSDLEKEAVYDLLKTKEQNKIIIEEKN